MNALTAKVDIKKSPLKDWPLRMPGQSLEILLAPLLSTWNQGSANLAEINFIYVLLLKEGPRTMFSELKF